jgi:predicted tellurium resistance membrane protein TerC
MIGYEDIDADIEKKTKSAGSVILWIVLMNLVFSFDSILSAMALTNVFAIMATAIVIGGILMIWLADRVSKFLEENKLYEVLGLFVLLIVGIMLLTEGGELSELIIMGNPIEKMSKTTFYFVIIILVLVDLVQSRYHKKLLAARNDKKS